MAHCEQFGKIQTTVFSIAKGRKCFGVHFVFTIYRMNAETLNVSMYTVH